MPQPHPKFERPSDPIVAQNQFRQQTAVLQTWPSFNKAKAQLPRPVLPEHTAWVQLYWHTWELAWHNLRQPAPDAGFVANYLDAGTEPFLFMWDSAFMSQFGLYGRRAFDFTGNLDNLYAKQHSDGFICRQIDLATGDDFFYPFDPNGTGPNVLAWAEWRHYRFTGDDDRLAKVFPALVGYHRWCRANRTWPNGLHWATGHSSGMSNQPRVPNSSFQHRHWTWVDASMQAALSSLVLAQMATLLKEEKLATALEAEHSRLSEQINEQLWNEATQFYQDVDPDGRFSPVKSVAAYWGLLDATLIPEKRREPFVKALRENWTFKLTHRIPSQSADSEGYNFETGNYWRGGVWPATNFMVLRGLRKIGQHGLAHEIAVNHLTNVAEVYAQTQALWENYSPETAAPGDPAAKNPIGMAGLTPIAILLEDVIGLTVDWPQRRVFWDRRLESERPYGVENYPLGPDGTLSMVADAAKLTLSTDVPFTLTLRDATQSLQTAVPSGTTEINLE
ncbi:MGH1-like glycoside hydrolase domain-containing protein [Candidatus Leptofilum sp.]|uniref:MGH1-like glycoside hydrolase domain-containing protein n=1 Tax=Candidatus Leptofilum sp. TaxID=3241576 RepID=UPI003B595A55